MFDRRDFQLAKAKYKKRQQIFDELIATETS
jgi:hypothetical protein